jgi:hypothetical protein
MHNDARDPRLVRPGLPENVYRFLEKAVKRDRDQRFQTALEFREALRAITPKAQLAMPGSEEFDRE